MKYLLALLLCVNSFAMIGPFPGATGGGGGGGTATSVGLSLPASVFTVTGTPVSIAGVLTGSFNTQSANKVFAGPTSGAAAAPTFRSLVAADLPSLTVSWGNITGTLSNQTDLQSALNAKQNSITTGTTSQFFLGNLSLATLSTTSIPEGTNLYYTTARVNSAVAALTGTGAGDIVVLNGSAQLPAVDGSLLTNLPGAFNSYSVSTTNNTPTALAIIPLAASSSYTCQAMVSGFRTDSSDYAHFQVTGSVHSNGGSTCAFEDSTIIYQKVSDVGFTTTFGCSTTNVTLSVTGNTGKSIDWKGSILCNSAN